MQWVPGLMGCTVDFVSENRTDRWDGSADNSACHVSLRAWGQSLHPIERENLLPEVVLWPLQAHHGAWAPTHAETNKKLKNNHNRQFLFIFYNHWHDICVWTFINPLTSSYNAYWTVSIPPLTIHVFATVTWRVDGLHSDFFLGFISPKCKLLLARSGMATRFIPNPGI